MEILGLQLDIVWEDRTANFNKVRRLLDQSAVAPSSLVVLPEMFSTGFSMNVPAISGGSEPFLADTAKHYGIYLLGGVVTTTPEGKGKNEAVLYDPQGKELTRYCKLHPFSYAGETDYFVPGDAIVTFEWAGMKAAVFICYDLRFPETFRHAVRQGTELFIIIANWPAPRALHWTALLQARAIENQAYVIGVNRCGTDPKHSYAGQSQIIAPRGEILADAGPHETLLRAPLDPQSLHSYRQDFPALRDIRPNL